MAELQGEVAPLVYKVFSNVLPRASEPDLISFTNFMIKELNSLKSQ